MVIDASTSVLIFESATTNVFYQVGNQNAFAILAMKWILMSPSV